MSRAPRGSALSGGQGGLGMEGPAAKRWEGEGSDRASDTFVRDRLPPPEAQPEFLFDLPELQYPERLNAAVELIDKGDPDAPAVINDSGRWTYGEMRDLSDRIARLLVEEEDLVPGDRVLLRGPNGAMLFACWLGVLKAGGIVVATMPVLRSGELATIVERARVHHAIVDDRFLGDFMTAADETGLIRSLLSYHGDSGGGRLEQRLKAVERGFAPADTRSRRRRPDRLHLGHDRQAERLRPLPPRHPRAGGQLRALRAEAASRAAAGPARRRSPSPSGSECCSSSRGASAARR